MKRATAGFTLIEVLVAMTIFSIISAAIASMMYYTTAMISQNSAASQAIVLAQERMEHLRNLAYDNLLPDQGLDIDEWRGIEFEVFWEVSDGPDTGTKTIEVTVQWDHKGEPKTYEVRSVYSQVTT